MDARSNHKTIVNLEPHDEIDLRRFIVAAFDSWRLIAKCAVAAIVVAILFILSATPTYRATAKISIDTRQQKVLTAEDILPGLAVDASVIESQVEQLTSTKIADRVLSELEGQQTKSEDAGKIRHTDKQIQDFLSHLVVARIGLTYLIEVSYSSPDPKMASQIANAVARTYIEEGGEAKVEIIRRANLWLRDRIKQLAPEVRELEEKVHDYRATNRLMELGNQSVVEQSVIDYIQQLALARSALAEAEAKLTLDKERSAPSLQSQNDYQVAKTKVALMEHGIEALTNDLMSRKKKAIQLGELEREADASKGLYESLLKRQKETEVQQNLQTVDARIIQEALPPAYPSWPKKSVLLLVFIAAGIVASTFYVISQVIRRDGAYSLPDIARHVGLPCDFAIPLTNLPSPIRRKRKNAVQMHEFGGEFAYAVSHRQTRFSQTLRLLLHKVRLRIGTESATVSVISPRSGDGRTLLASNLAFMAGDLGEKVLLLDISLDKDLSRMVERIGPSGTLGGKADDTRSQFIELQNGTSKIHFYGWPRGQRSENILPADEIQDFISQMRKHYSIIILDTAPFAENVDTLSIIQHSDAAILVVSKVKTPLRDVRSMISSGDLAEKTNLTLVFNRA